MQFGSTVASRTGGTLVSGPRGTPSQSRIPTLLHIRSTWSESYFVEEYNLEVEELLHDIVQDEERI